MKKILTVFMTLSLILTLSACSSPSKENIRGEQTLGENELSNSDEEFALGSTTNTVYENKFIGIGCSFDNSWYFYTDEEIMQLNNYVADVQGEEYEEMMKNADVVYDMFAMNDNLMDNISVNLEKTNPLSLATMNIKESLKATIDPIKTSFDNMGYTDFKAEVTTAKIEDQEFTCLWTTAQMQDITVYQKIIPIKCNGYLANLTLTTYQEDTIDNLLNDFYIIK